MAVGSGARAIVGGGRLAAAACLAVMALVGSASCKTRWSSIYLVPDADMLGRGQFLASFDGFVAKTAQDETLFRQTYLYTLGVVEFVNLHLGYAGGFTLGFKARILGETRDYVPSLAIGAHNIFSNKEGNYYDRDQGDNEGTELFLALGKTVETIKTRFHMGIQTVPSSETELVNPYFAVEKFFGIGLYTSFILHRRKEAFRMSLFANWRLLKNHLELTVGAVDLKSMFFAGDGVSPTLVPAAPGSFTRPGIWVGLRFQHALGIGGAGGFGSVEDRLGRQIEDVTALRAELDSLRSQLKDTREAVSDVDESVQVLSDSVSGSTNRMKTVMMEKLVGLKALYAADHFEPDRVRMAVNEVVSYRDRAVPALKEILVDPKVDRRIRMFAASMLGEVANREASDALLDVIAQTGDTDIKIEILIALGKMKETRAMYLMEQLASDPDDAVALAAQEVVKRMAEETGARISDGTAMRPVPPLPDAPAPSIAPSPGPAFTPSVPATPAGKGTSGGVATKTAEPAPAPGNAGNAVPPLPDTTAQ